MVIEYSLVKQEDHNGEYFVVGLDFAKIPIDERRYIRQQISAEGMITYKLEGWDL